MVVMSETARKFLIEIYGLDPSRISLAPHGIPDLPFVDPNYYKDQFGVEGKKVIATFGLLSRNKGIETMVEALPEILAAHVDFIERAYGTVGVLDYPNARADRDVLARPGRDLAVLGRAAASRPDGPHCRLADLRRRSGR